MKKKKVAVILSLGAAALLMIGGISVYAHQFSDSAESELSQKCGDCSTDKQVYCCTLVIEGLGTFTLNKD